MRSVWQRHERVAYVVSGSAPSVLRHMVFDRASPFFQHFDVMELGPMGHDDATALLREGSEGAIPVGLADRLVDLTGGHPFYFQVLGEELLHVPGPVDDEALREALQPVDSLLTVKSRCCFFSVDRNVRVQNGFRCCKSGAFDAYWCHEEPMQYRGHPVKKML